ARHRRAQDRGADGGETPASPQGHSHRNALSPNSHAYPAGRPTRAVRRTDREIGRQRAGGRARRKGLRLDPRGGMTEPYVKDFQAFASNGAAGAPPWLREIREGAIARFTALGFPTTKQEAWRFTSVAPIAATHFARPASGLPPLALRDIAALSIIGTEGGPRRVLGDGRYDAGPPARRGPRT